MKRNHAIHPLPREAENLPPVETTEKLKSRLIEVDQIDVDFDSDYFDGLCDKIMARIEKTSIAELEPKLPQKKKAKKKEASSTLTVL